MLEAIQESQLIHQDRTQSEASRRCLTLSRHRTMRRKDTLKVLVQVLHRQRAQLVEDTPHFHAIVGVRILARLTRHQATVPKMAVRPQLLPVVMLIAKDKNAPPGALPPTTAGQLRHHRCWQPSVEPQEESRHRLLPKRYAVPSRIPTRATDFVQPASISMRLCGTTPLSLSFLCQSAPSLARSTVLSMAAARPQCRHGCISATKWRPRQPICAGSVWGSAASLLSKVFRVG